jgi:alanyl-tRNA synthetase
LTYLAALTRQRHDAAEAVRSLEETSTRLRKMGDHAQSSAALIDAVIISQNENLAQAARRLLPRLLSLRRLATDRGACWR